MQKKKESLFKQKLKQVKLSPQQQDRHIQVQNNETLSFPKVFKIDELDIQKHSEGKIQQICLNSQVIDDKESMSSKFDDIPYLQKNRQNWKGILSEQELNQINNQNWNTVQSMNEEERKNYINLIQNTLPKIFIQKIKKKDNQLKEIQPQFNHKNTPTITKKITSSNSNSSLNHQNQGQIQFEKTQIKQEIKQKLPHNAKDENESQKDIIQNFCLDIASSTLCYAPEEAIQTFKQESKENFVRISTIYQMLTSGNNQSQIIGCQLTLEWIKNVYPTNRSILLISSVPFHSTIMLCELYSLIKIIQSNIKSNKFYSCYIQTLVKVVEILTLTYRTLSNSQLAEQISFVAQEFQKSQKALKEFTNSKQHNQQSIIQKTHQRQSKQLVFQSLGIVLQSLMSQKTARQEKTQKRQLIQIQDQVQQLNTKLDDLIETILIEQTLTKEEFDQYEIHPHLNIFLQTITDFFTFKIKPDFSNFSDKLAEVHQFFNLVYQLICKLNKKKREFLFYKSLIDQIFLTLLRIFQNQYLQKVLQQLFSKNLQEKISFKKNCTLNQFKMSIVFKALFIYRQLSSNTDKFTIFLENKKKNWVMADEQVNIVVYINLINYLQVQDLKPDEIQMIQKMLNWLKKAIKGKQTKEGILSINEEEVLISLLDFFLSEEQEIYSLIDQNILFDIFKSIVVQYERANSKNSLLRNKILTESQIKQMVKNYSFNSFGNDIFTKIIFWMAVSSDQEIQALIAEQVMMRYPMLFYYASEPFKSSTEQNNCMDSEIKNTLLGDLSQYIRTNLDPIKHYFSYKSNEQIKINLLKLLFLNLNFQKVNLIDFKCLKQFIDLEIQKSIGFNFQKNELNEQNLFYQYLIQPLIQKGKKKECF